MQYMKHYLSFIISTLWFCLLTFVPGMAQPGSSNFFFNHVDSRNGLSENTVKSMVQDSWGFLWIGTKNGLNRFAGNSIKHYKVYDEKKRHGNQNISSLYEDKDHRL